MSEDSFPPAQISFFMGGDRNAAQVVFRGSLEEIASQLAAFVVSDPADDSSYLTSMIADLDTIRAALLVANKLNGQNTSPGDGFTPNNVPADPWNSGGSESHECPVPGHGSMRWKEGKTAANKEYKGYFCSVRGCTTKPIWK